MNEPTRDQELLARAIRASGLTPRQYAKRVLIRDPRMIRRWLAGQYQLPKEVRAHLEQLEKSRLEDEDGDKIERATREATQQIAAERLAEGVARFRLHMEATRKEWTTRAEDRLEEGVD